jgi:hypothetical protein
VNDLFWRNEITLTSSYGGSPADYAAALELVQAGKIRKSSPVLFVIASPLLFVIARSRRRRGNLNWLNSKIQSPSKPFKM